MTEEELKGGSSWIPTYVIAPPRPESRRDPTNDLLDLLGQLEEAYRENAIDTKRLSGARLADALIYLRRWWP